MQLAQTVLLVTVIIVVFTTTTQAIICTNLTNDEGICSNWQSDIIITNESSTSVLVQWRHYTMNSDDEVLYDITYSRTPTSGSIISQTEFTTNNSTILVYLLSNTTYCIIVCVNNTDNNTCCARNFRTTEQNRQDQVQNVRAHVYYPLLNNQDIISAQVIWTSLSSGLLKPSLYEIQIFTADADKLPIEGSPFLYADHRPFKTLERRNEINELEFPLEENTQYIIQVSGKHKGNQYSFSEPIKISTFFHEPAMELFVTTDQQGSVLAYPPGSSHLLIGSTDLAVHAPIALDKKTRNVFYVSKQQQGQYNVIKADIDNPADQHTLYTLTDFKPLAMAYDWIAQKLYIVARKLDNNHLNIISLTLKMVLQLVHDTGRHVADSTFVEMTLNPLEGLLHWTEFNSQVINNSIYCLKFHHKPPSSSLFYNGAITSGLTEDVLRNCLYFINRQPLQIMSLPLETDNDAICYGNYTIDEKFMENLGSVKLTVDDTGIYFTGRRNGRQTLVYYNFENESNKEVINDFINNTITTIETTSPGTQPLPNALMCLSPDFSNVDNRPHPKVNSNTTSSILLSWNIPQWPSSCNGMSRPPLVYSVYVKDLSGVFVNGYDPKKTCYPGINVTKLTSGVKYNITISARTDYTIGSPNDLLLGQPLIAAPLQQEISPMPSPTQFSSHSVNLLSSSVTMIPISSTTLKSVTSESESSLPPTSSTTPLLDNNPQSTTTLVVIGLFPAIALLIVIIFIAIVIILIVKYNHYVKNKDQPSSTHQTQAVSENPIFDDNYVDPSLYYAENDYNHLASPVVLSEEIETNITPLDATYETIPSNVTKSSEHYYDISRPESDSTAVYIVPKNEAISYNNLTEQSVDYLQML